tara:strand:+ start:5659 stop:6858 length:1200 start_codon:yes stop_codon:yes gene_type:complete
MNEETLVNFGKVVDDFLGDLKGTFPDLNDHWTIIEKAEKKQLSDYCLQIYPERFFDIIYQNDDIFKPENNVNTYFLPSLDFKIIFNDPTVSENTKKTIWKYLQLLMFTIVGNIKDKKDFGDCMNIFDGIDENALQGQLKETMDGISDFFKNIGVDEDHDDDNDENNENDDDKPKSNPFRGSMPNMPDLDGMKSHLNSLFNGKIGSLAKEMAEEISGEFVDLLGGDNINTSNIDQKEIMKKLMKNPKKIMELMKKVTGKLDEKLKSGNISRDEIMKEATDIMGKMKEMGGGDEFNDLMKNLTKGMGKGMKFNKGAFNAMQKDMERREQLKERIRKKSTLQKKNANESVFKIVDEEQERTARLKADEAMELLLAEEEKEKIEKEKAPPSKSKSKKKKKKKA